MKPITDKSDLSQKHPNSFTPDGLMFAKKTDTAGILEKADRKKKLAAFFKAKNKRNPLPASLEKHLPSPMRKVYYDFSVAGYLAIFFMILGLMGGFVLLVTTLIRS